MCVKTCSYTKGFMNLLDGTSKLDFVAPLLLRIFLFMVFWEAGYNKFVGFEGTVYWFGEHLGLPFPWLLAALATATELVGAVLILFGLFTRVVAVPLIVTMLVAIFAVHFENGFLAIAATDSYWFGQSEAAQRLSGFMIWLQDAHPGRYRYLTAESSSIVALNNGFEFAAIYLLMLISLFFTGAGKYVSVDYYLRKWYDKKA